MARFSLVLGTKDRVRELRRFLTALDAQSHRQFELVVVDQNDDDRLVRVLREFEKRFPIIRLRAKPGLSRARNSGLCHASGEVIAFPDDDCWYPPDLLARVSRFFQEQPMWHGLLGRLVWDAHSDEAGMCSPIPVNIYSATTSVDAATRLRALFARGSSLPASSATLFLTREIIEAIDGFDESLGIGAGTEWKAGDDVDLVVRCLRSGFKLCHVPTLKVYHPHPRRDYADTGRGYSYGAGMGRVLRKHRYPGWFVAYHLLRSLGAAGGALLQAEPRKLRYHWAVFRGKLNGWRWSSDLDESPD